MTAPTGLTSARDQRHWELFEDWCLSLDLTPVPTTPEVIGRFLTAFPAALSTQGHRVRAIRRRHEAAGARLELPTATEVPTALRQGQGWVPVPRALAQLSVYAHPKHFDRALRGRRDGWLIVLIGVLGLNRNRARRLRPDQVHADEQISIAGRPVPAELAGPPGECPACAVTRWLRVAGAASFGFRGDVIRLLRPDGVDPETHDCTRDLDVEWREASTLLPAIDRHGWVSAVPMSPRAITATMAHRQAPAPVAELPQISAPPPASGSLADASLDDLDEVYDDVDRRTAELMLRIQAVLEACEG